MTDDSLYTPETEIIPNGILDIPGVADLAVGDEVYISADNKVTELPANATLAMTRKRLGWATRPYDYSDEAVASIQTKYKRIVTRLAHASVTYGDRLVFAFDTTSTAFAVRPFSSATDSEDLIIGLALESIWAALTGDVLEE